jgi:hypothetical protein
MSRDCVQTRRIMKMQNVYCLLLGILVFGVVGPGLTVADPADRTITAPGDPLNGRPYWEVLARCAGVQAALSVADIADEIVRAGDPKQKNREATWAKFHGNRDTLEDTGLLFLRSAGRFLIEDRHVSNEQAKAINNQQFAQGQALTLEVAVPQANACIGAYQLCQTQYPKVCSSKLP